MRATRRIPALLGTVALAVGLALVPTNAQAVQVVGCSEGALVNAINAANLIGGDDLVLAPFCTYTLTLAHSTDGGSGLPDITTPITLSGISTQIVRSSTAADFRVLKVDGQGLNSGELKLSGVTVRGGKAAAGQPGGGIANLGGDVLLVSSTLRNNEAALGGGLYNETGTANLAASTVVGNTATTAGGGGGIYEASGSVNLVTTLVSANSPNNCAPLGSVPFCGV
ncbi:hypothetical protein [Streptomyces sp. NPDC048639]|uniref:hypothetical protein n=1 Tax=Streptomyces sp. NPDC048639 TaxID=3365581 RepID=UPI003712C81D